MIDPQEDAVVPETPSEPAVTSEEPVASTDVQPESAE